MAINTWLAQMLLGDDSAFAGQTRVVMSGRHEVNGVERSLFGGILLGHKATAQWEAFDGSVIFIPSQQLAVPDSFRGYRLDQCVVELAYLEPRKGKQP